MSKLYKQISTCYMCKERFTIVKGMSYTSYRYCANCQTKYFPKKDVQII